MEMKKIASFQVDHNKLDRGIYLSRIDGDIITYDIRMRKPNHAPFLDMPAVHTIEHLFATFVRSGEFSDHIIYFGPMGCRTGFYFITRGLTHKTVLELIKKAFLFIAEYKGKVPGCSASECGNWLEHDLEGARMESKRFLPILENYTEEQLVYPS